MWVTSGIWRHAMCHINLKVRCDCTFQNLKALGSGKDMVAWKGHLTFDYMPVAFQNKEVI
jgi:hypothetical protein